MQIVSADRQTGTMWGCVASSRRKAIVLRDEVLVEDWRELAVR